MDAHSRLRALARLHGVQTDYSEDGEIRRARPEALRAVLAARGVEAAGEKEVASALRRHRRALFSRMVPPVTIVWRESAQKHLQSARPLSGGRQSAAARLRVPAARLPGRLKCTLVLESGEVREWTVRPEELPTAGRRRLHQDVMVRMNLPLEPPRGPSDGSSAPGQDSPETLLPLGYHRLTIETIISTQGARRESVAKSAFEVVEASGLVIVAPSSSFMGDAARRWGLFMPLYALRTERSTGIGDLTDLGRLAEFAAERGGSAVGTLPLLASFLGGEHVPGPYSPASRLFWNEIYLDPGTAPGIERCPEARAFLASAGVRDALNALLAERLVDYAGVAAVKRRVLELLARDTIGGDGPPPAFVRFVEDRPRVRDYARFRAAGEKRGGPWREWPLRMREGRLKEGDFDPDGERYHLYVQWAFHEQAENLARSAASSGVALYLDLPLGAHPDSYDAWREQELHAGGVSVGAPPDAFFAGGQDWGFAPPDPVRMRRSGYRHFRACLRNHLRYAGILRLDHVMSLHRLYWIPSGHSPRDGVYVRYPTEELFAILCLESRRAHTELVGEDLGTVAPAIRRRMRDHGIRRMYVAQFQLDAGAERPLRPVPEGAVASINTHDMPTFAAFWHGLDIDERMELGLLDAASAARERARREELVNALRRLNGSRRPDRTGSAIPRSEVDPANIRDALLRRLARSSAGMVLVSLEDLWLETESQNMPGTWKHRPNWRRRSRLSLEEIAQREDVTRALSIIDRATAESRAREVEEGEQSDDEKEGRELEDDADESAGRA